MAYRAKSYGRVYHNLSHLVPLYKRAKKDVGKNQYPKGVQVAVGQINANGGIMGRQVQIITADIGGDAVDAVPALRKLINVDQVNLIVGPSSLEAQAVLPILQQSKIPDVIVGGTTQLDNLT